MHLYDIIRTAYRSRFLARTEAEFREIAGISFETIRDRREDQDLMLLCYDRLNRECISQCGKYLSDMMDAYLTASEVYLGNRFDWLERRQLASRKKFCRWLFRRSAAPDRPLRAEEEFRYSPKDCDDLLFSHIYPDGLEGGRVVDVVFLLLLTFKVIRPISLDSERSRDISDEEAYDSAQSLASLVALLRDDTPRIGVLPKPLVFDISLESIRRSVEDGLQDYTAARVWGLLNQIEEVCRSVSSPRRTAEFGNRQVGYSMTGIWVDDVDEGRSRFWIFPENKLMAFCYRKERDGWRLTPFELSFLCKGTAEDIEDYCVIATAKATEQVVDNDGVMDPSEVVTAHYEPGDVDDEGATFSEISFEVESGERPKWMDWNMFRRLERGCEMYERYKGVVAEIYDVESPHHLLFENEGTVLTDQVEALLGMDREWLYISDVRRPDRFMMQWDDDDTDRFWYEPVYRDGLPATGVLSCEVSEEHPLYLVPRVGDMSRRMSPGRRRLMEAAANTDMDGLVTIYHTARHPEGVLCFNRLSVVFPLDDKAAELCSYGVQRLTKR